MAIIYAGVARGKVALAEFSAVTGNSGAVVRRILEKLSPETADERLCFSQESKTVTSSVSSDLRDFHIGWFIHPLVYGEYPKTMQNIVKERLPKFTEEQVKMVKGSIDFVGINQYTTYFMSDTHNSTIPKDLGYQQLSKIGMTFGFAKLRKPIGPRGSYTLLLTTFEVLMPFLALEDLPTL